MSNRGRRASTRAPSSRLLRNNVYCTSHPNIFRNQTYIMNSGCHHLPEDIFKKVTQRSALSCNEINSQTFIKNQPHERILNKMKEALIAQTKTINNNLNCQLGENWSHLHEGIRIIKSEDRECDDEEILNHPCFKDELQKILLS